MSDSFSPTGNTPFDLSEGSLEKEKDSSAMIFVFALVLILYVCEHICKVKIRGGSNLQTSRK